MIFYKLRPWLHRYVSNKLEKYPRREDNCKKDKLCLNIMAKHAGSVPYFEMNRKNIDYTYLLENPEAVELIKDGYGIEITSNTEPLILNYWDETYDKNYNFLGGYRLSANPSAFYLLEKYPNMVNIHGLLANPNLDEWFPNTSELIINNEIHIFGRIFNWTNWGYVEWGNLSNTPTNLGIEILKRNPEKINWDEMSSNKYKMELIKQHPEKIVWCYFSNNENSQAINILKKNIDKIEWNELCINENAHAVELLKRFDENIDWELLSYNSYAMDLLEENKEKLNYYYLSHNSAIFQPDYDTIKNMNKDLNEELIQWFWHPNRVQKLIEQGLEVDEL